MNKSGVSARETKKSNVNTHREMSDTSNAKKSQEDGFFLTGVKVDNHQS